MASNRNIFISFQLLHPERGDQRVRETIEDLGVTWAKLANGIFYLHGDLDVQYVGNKVWSSLNMDDKLLVVDTTNNDARWYNIKPEVSDFMIKNWGA